MSGMKQLWSLARVGLSGVGFTLICAGCYLASQQAYCNYFPLIAILGYVLIAFGFLAILTGVFWTICHSVKSKIQQRGGHNLRREHDQHIHIFTIDRPSHFPPSYEESQRSHVCPDGAADSALVVNEVGLLMTPAPPLYIRESSETPDCSWSWEQPPRYTQDTNGPIGMLGNWDEPCPQSVKEVMTVPNRLRE